MLVIWPNLAFFSREHRLLEDANWFLVEFEKNYKVGLTRR